MKPATIMKRKEYVLSSFNRSRTSKYTFKNLTTKATFSFLTKTTFIFAFENSFILSKNNFNISELTLNSNLLQPTVISGFKFDEGIHNYACMR